MSNKPLHRFVRQDPRSFGIAILIFGCAELLMGFHLRVVGEISSFGIYSPFWEGLLFSICGVLSIYTDRHPSKKMVTVCLALYITSIFGFFVSFGNKVYIFSMSDLMWYKARDKDWIWGYNKCVQVLSVEAVLLTCSVCVLVLLIFLTAVARLALKSTHTDVAIQCVTYPPSVTTSD